MPSDSHFVFACTGNEFSFAWCAIHVVCANNFLKYKRKLHVEKQAHGTTSVHFQLIHVSEPLLMPFIMLVGLILHLLELPELFFFFCSAVVVTPSHFSVTVGMSAL